MISLKQEIKVLIEILTSTQSFTLYLKLSSCVQRNFYECNLITQS